MVFRIFYFITYRITAPFIRNNFLRMKHVFLTICLFLTAFSGISQEFEVSGTVTDGNSPMPGVLVRVENASQFTQTDNSGNYSLQLEAGVHHLIFSFGNQKRIRIELSEDMV